MSTIKTNSRVARRKDHGPGFLRVLTTFIVGLAIVVGSGVGVAYLTRSDDAGQTASANAPSSTSRASTSTASTSITTAVSPRSTVSSAPAAPTAAEQIADARGATLPSSRVDATDQPSETPASAAEESVAVSLTDGQEAESGVEGEAVEVDSSITYGEAEATFLARDYDLAAAQFAVYADEHPENVWGAYMHGLSLWKSGRSKDAESVFLSALDIDGSHQKSLINLARVRLELGNAEEARMPIERALEVDAESIAAHRVHARVLHNLGEREAAARAYQEALRRDPEDAWSLNNYGWMIAEAGRFTESLPPLARATEVGDELEPSVQAIFQNNLGAALEGAGYYNAAAHAYAAAVEADSTYDRASVSLARVEPLRPSQSLPDPDLRELAQQFLETLGAGLAMADDVQP